LELQTGRFHEGTISLSGYSHLLSFCYSALLLLKAEQVQDELSIRRFRQSKRTLDRLLTLRSFLFTLVEQHLSLVQLISLLQFLTGEHQVFLGTSYLFSFELFLLQHFCSCYLYQFLPEQSLGFLLTVTLIQASMTQQQVETQFFTNTFSGSSVTLKFIFLSYQHSESLVKLFLPMQESQFSVTLVGFTLGSLLVSSDLSYELTTGIQ